MARDPGDENDNTREYPVLNMDVRKLTVKVMASVIQDLEQQLAEMTAHRDAWRTYAGDIPCAPGCWTDKPPPYTLPWEVSDE